MCRFRRSVDSFSVFFFLYYLLIYWTESATSTVNAHPPTEFNWWVLSLFNERHPWWCRYSPTCLSVTLNPMLWVISNILLDLVQKCPLQVQRRPLAVMPAPGVHPNLYSVVGWLSLGSKYGHWLLNSNLLSFFHVTLMAPLSSDTSSHLIQ